MGCFVSSNRTSTSSPVLPKSSTSQEKCSQSNEQSFQTEEETVKEVLSETLPKLIFNPQTTVKSKPQKPHQNNIMVYDKFKEEQSKFEKKPLPINKPKDISEVRTMSTTTASITDHREEGEQTGKRVTRSPAKLQRNRSFSDDYGGRRERPMHGSRNVGSARLVQCRDQEGQRTVRRRRDPGEYSFRRPMLRATCSDAGTARSIVGRSPSMRRTSQSPPVERCPRVENPVKEGKRPFAKESLENPLVSLECFIFI